MKIEILYPAFRKLRAWVNQAEEEVSGLGLVTPIDPTKLTEIITVEDVFILPQECSIASTVIDTQSIGRLLLQLSKENQEHKLKLWWHSHAAGDTFWSTTDSSTIQHFQPEDYFLAIVMNRAGKILSRLDLFKPFRVTVDDIPTLTHFDAPEFLAESLQDVNRCIQKYHQPVAKTPRHQISKRFPSMFESRPYLSETDDHEFYISEEEVARWTSRAK